MTTKDLRIQFHSQANETPFDPNFKITTDSATAEYILWLEQKVLEEENTPKIYKQEVTI